MSTTNNTDNDILQIAASNISRTLINMSGMDSFFAQLLGSCKKGPSPLVGTMFVGGTGKLSSPIMLGYSPEFVANVPASTQAAAGAGISLLQRILKHEAAHIALGHVLRSVGEGKDRNVWRVACEYSANKVAGITGDMVMLDGTTITPQTYELGNISLGRNLFTADDSTQSYYDKLMQLTEKERAACSAGTEMEEWGELIEGLGEAEVRSIVNKARARVAGNLPAGMLLEMGEWLEPKVRWQDLIRDEIARNISALRTVTPYRLHRRHPFLYPGSKLKPQADVAIVVDTSRSMGEGRESLLMEAMNEVKGIMEIVGGTCTFITCDAEATVAHVNSIEEIELKGGGGTMLNVAFQAIKEMDTPPSQIICLTDGDNYGAIEDINLPTIFGIVGGNTSCTGASFGTTIVIT